MLVSIGDGSNVEGIKSAPSLFLVSLLDRRASVPIASGRYTTGPINIPHRTKMFSQDGSPPPLGLECRTPIALFFRSDDANVQRDSHIVPRIPGPSSIRRNFLSPAVQLPSPKSA